MKRMAVRHEVGDRSRRGTLLVSVIVVLLMLQLLAVGLVTAGARDHDLTTRRAETMQAFYAAEAGANMAVRELMTDADGDGDGIIGSVSNDGSEANDPAIGVAKVGVVKVTGVSEITLTSTGRCGESRRSISLTLQ